MDQVKFVEDSLFKIWSDMVCLSRPYHFKFFKDSFTSFTWYILEYLDPYIIVALYQKIFIFRIRQNHIFNITLSLPVLKHATLAIQNLCVHSIIFQKEYFDLGYGFLED